MWFVWFAHLKLRYLPAAQQDLKNIPNIEQEPTTPLKKTNFKRTKHYKKKLFRDIIYIYFQTKLSSATVQ